MGFQGLSISDDLEMGAILEYTTPLSVVEQGLKAGLDFLLYRQGGQAMLSLVAETNQQIVINKTAETAFSKRLHALQEQHPACFLSEPPSCTLADYDHWMTQAKQLTEEAITTIFQAFSLPKILLETPLWLVLPNAQAVLPHYAEDAQTHPSLSSLFVKAGYQQVKTSYYSTLEEEAVLGQLIQAERKRNPKLTVLVATWLPKVGQTLLKTLASSSATTLSEVDSNPVLHWTIGGAALPSTNLSQGITELPFFGYRPEVQAAVVNALSSVGCL
jgi:beta-glucosidase-like glycosyl hydrolase